MGEGGNRHHRPLRPDGCQHLRCAVNGAPGSRHQQKPPATVPLPALDQDVKGDLVRRHRQETTQFVLDRAPELLPLDRGQSQVANEHLLARQADHHAGGLGAVTGQPLPDGRGQRIRRLARAAREDRRGTKPNASKAPRDQGQTNLVLPEIHTQYASSEHVGKRPPQGEDASPGMARAASSFHERMT